MSSNPDAKRIPVAQPAQKKPGLLRKIGLAFSGIREGRSWQKRFDPSAPKVGDMAPDFELSDVNGENQIRLSQFFGQGPVALVFGSFT
jgi:hypothetical protein